MKAPAVSSTSRHWGWEGDEGGTVGGQDCAMDKLGNWLKYNGNNVEDVRTYNHSTHVNAIATRSAGGTLTYDDNGNLTSNGTSYKCIYDFRNRLIEVTDLSDVTIAEYSYDGLNRMIEEKTYSGETLATDTRYIFNGGWQIIEELDEMDSSALVARYVYGTQYIDEPVVMYRDQTSDGDFADTDEVLYYLQDRLFNVVALTNVSGEIREQVYYEPYGRATHRLANNTEQDSSNLGNRLTFTGRPDLAITCLKDYRNRIYSAALGRFLQRDPIGYLAGNMNLFQYVSNQPINNADPFGYFNSDPNAQQTPSEKLGKLPPPYVKKGAIDTAYRAGPLWLGVETLIGRYTDRVSYRWEYLGGKNVNNCNGITSASDWYEFSHQKGVTITQSLTISGKLTGSGKTTSEIGLAIEAGLSYTFSISESTVESINNRLQVTVGPCSKKRVEFFQIAKDHDVSGYVDVYRTAFWHTHHNGRWAFSGKWTEYITEYESYVVYEVKCNKSGNTPTATGTTSQSMSPGSIPQIIDDDGLEDNDLN